MALPPRGDPRRPLHLAIRSTRLLGVIFLLAATCASLPMLLGGGIWRGGRMLVFSIVVLVIYVVPGAAYFLLSIFLGRRQFWAVVASLVLASIQLMFTLLAAIGITMAALSAPNGTFSIIIILLIYFVVAALVQLVYHLARSFEAIKHLPADQMRGFEPLMPDPAKQNNPPEPHG